MRWRRAAGISSPLTVAGALPRAPSPLREPEPYTKTSDVATNATMTIRRMNFNPLKYCRMAPISTTTSLERSRVFPAENLAYHRSADALDGEERADDGEGEVDHESRGGAVHHAVDLPPLAAQKLDRAVGDEARPDAVGDRVGKGHERHGEERRESFLEIAERDVADERGHEEADQDERGRRRLRGHDPGHRFDIGRRRRGARGPARYRRQRIDEQDAVQARKPALGSEPSRLGPHP